MNYDSSINAQESGYLYIKSSAIKNAGNGLFTAIKIYKDELVSIYCGEIISNKEANSRAQKNEDLYFISLPSGKILDSMHVEGFAKYANDANGKEKSNLKNNTKITLDEKNRPCLIATKNISPYSEIYCGYGKAYWKKHGSIKT